MFAHKPKTSLKKQVSTDVLSEEGAHKRNGSTGKPLKSGLMAQRTLANKKPLDATPQMDKGDSLSVDEDSSIVIPDFIVDPSQTSDYNSQGYGAKFGQFQSS